MGRYHGEGHSCLVQQCYGRMSELHNNQNSNSRLEFMLQSSQEHCGMLMYTNFKSGAATDECNNFQKTKQAYFRVKNTHADWVSLETRLKRGCHKRLQIYLHQMTLSYCVEWLVTLRWSVHADAVEWLVCRTVHLCGCGRWSAFGAF